MGDENKSDQSDDYGPKLQHQTTTFNKNAAPFVPFGSSSGYSTNPSSINQKYAQQPLNQLPSYHNFGNCYVQLDNLPVSITKHNLEELIDSIILSDFSDFPEPTTYQVVKFTHEPGTATGKENEPESRSDTNGSGTASAVLEIPNWTFCAKLIEIVNGYEWLDKILDISLTSVPTMEYRTAAPRANSPYYNPFYSGSYMANVANVGNAALGTSGSNMVPSAGIPQSRQPSSGAYDYGSAPIYHPQYPHQLPPIPHPFQLQPRIPMQLPPGVPLPQGYPGSSNIALTPSTHTPPRQFLSRRSSSSKSFDSRRNSRNNSFTSNKNSVSSTSSTSLSGANALGGSSASAGSTKQPVPSFIMNLVNNRTRNMSNVDTSSSNSPTTEELDEEIDEAVHSESAEISEPVEVEEDSSEPLQPDEESFIFIKDEDEGEMIRVNPCRLFIGNVPYSSNWASLKKFLISKARELEPSFTLSILRVEIPMQSITSTNNMGGSDDGYQGFIQPPRTPSFDELYFSASQGGSTTDAQQMNHLFAQPVFSKSRGFAIVTTGNKESSDKLIELFDNMEFEGRSLTVRYDKFPDYNNYVIQQLYSGNSSASSSYGNPNPSITASNSSSMLPGYNYNPNKYGSRKNSFHGSQSSGGGSSVISNLAFERNSFQQKFYYGGGSTGPSIVPGGPGYYVYPYYFNSNTNQNQPPISSVSLPPLQTAPPGVGFSQFNNTQSSVSPSSSALFFQQQQTASSQPLSSVSNTIEESREQSPLAKEAKIPYTAKLAVSKTSSPAKQIKNKVVDEQFKKNQMALTDEEKARDLVNSFGQLGIGPENKH
ncbi:hypothetical protein G9P44_000809 [Scheffersomyces stipitis]|nr:hypothetical protein G9P44_000809 [Scheffersomyces stipitis]